MAKKPVSRPQRMVGQDPKSEGTYRFSGSTEKGTTRMDPTDYKLMNDINARDRADIKSAEEKARSGKPLTKMERMAYQDAVNRQNRLGYKAGKPTDGKYTGEGDTLAEGKAQRDRLKKLYGADKKAAGGRVKKMAKGGKVTRGDGIAKKGHTKGKMV
jgi:hypothetical protein